MKLGENDRKNMKLAGSLMALIILGGISLSIVCCLVAASLAKLLGG